MENTKTVNIQIEDNFNKNNSNGNSTNNIIPNNRLSKRSINMSLLTTKTDEISDKITYSDKKMNTLSHQTSNIEDDSILENLKSKGLLNKTLVFRIDEYKNDLKKTLKKDKNISKIELINEIKLFKRNIHIASIEQENFWHLNQLKEKKVGILESSIFSVNNKIKTSNDKINKIIEKYKGKENKIKKNKLNKNLKNILIQHCEIFSYDLLKSLSIKEEEKDPKKLEKVDLRIKIYKLLNL
jgi:hypothetical protein